MKPNKFEIFIGSGFLTGFYPFASGTAGSAVAFFFYFIPGFNSYTFLIPAVVLSLFWGVYLGTKFENLYGKDPSEFTLDEFTGSWIALLFIPQNYVLIIAAFVLWRLLDIFKPFPANRLEDINGGWGIMLDDVISGTYTLIIMFFVEELFF